MTTPSNETLDYKIEAMEKQNAKEHKLLFEKIDGIDSKLDWILDKFESKFAAKRTERVIKWMVGLILISVFTTILKGVLLNK